MANNAPTRRAPIATLLFSPDSNSLYSSSMKVRQWDVSARDSFNARRQSAGLASARRSLPLRTSRSAHE